MNLAEKLNGALERLAKDLGTLQTGRARQGMLGAVMVDGKPLEHMAKASVVDARTLVVVPWDVEKFKPAVQALTKANVGQVSEDGRVITVRMPVPSQERREELAKTAKIFAENALVTVRGVRREAMKASYPSEDETHRHHKAAQLAITAIETEIENLTARKVKEILHG
jgi:ribosome recycling factor